MKIFEEVIFNIHPKNGISVTVSQPDSKHQSSDIKLQVRKKHPFSFKLVSEGMLIQFFKSLNVIKEIQLGDEEWDRAVYIIGDSLQIKTLLLDNQKLKSSIRSLTDLGFKLEFSNNSIWATKNNLYYLKVDEEGTKAIDLLSEIIDSLGIFSDEQVIDSDFGGVVLFVFMFFFMTFIVFTLYFIAQSSEDHIIHLGGYAGFYGFLLGGVFGVIPLVIWKLFRKPNSRTHYEFLALAFVTPLILSITGASSSLFLNRILDTDHGTIVKARLNNKRWFRTKYGYNYRLIYGFEIPQTIKKSYKKGHFENSVNQYGYEYAKIGDYKMIRVYPGFFGQPWFMQ